LRSSIGPRGGNSHDNDLVGEIILMGLGSSNRKGLSVRHDIFSTSKAKMQKEKEKEKEKEKRKRKRKKKNSPSPPSPHGSF